jgi:hypothetical protein
VRISDLRSVRRVIKGGRTGSREGSIVGLASVETRKNP